MESPDVKPPEHGSGEAARIAVDEVAAMDLTRMESDATESLGRSRCSEVMAEVRHSHLYRVAWRSCADGVTALTTVASDLSSFSLCFVDLADRLEHNSFDCDQL
jgi:hypothetical protein